jgi:hypothetical protein
MSTYDVKVWSIREYKSKDRKTGKARSTYRVRWVVAGKQFGETFQTRPLAESFRSKLIVAQREGTAFDELVGLPEPMARQLTSRTWYEHAIAFVDMKWPRSAAAQRKSIAESLATVTPALLSSTRGAPAEHEIRRALFRWSYNRTRRESGPPPPDLERTVRWLSAKTVRPIDLNDTALIRKALDTLATRLDGTSAAANTVARKRAIFYGALRYAVELRLLPAHPMDHVRWTPQVDRRGGPPVGRQPRAGYPTTLRGQRPDAPAGGILRPHVLRGATARRGRSPSRRRMRATRIRLGHAAPDRLDAARRPGLGATIHRRYWKSAS